MKGLPVVEAREESLREILERARAGDREAFDQFIRRFEGLVMRTALYLTRNLHDAQDVAQEVYLKIFRQPEALDRVEKLNAWIYRVTVNAARDLQRSKRFWVPLEKIFSFSRPSDSVGELELTNRLIDSLRKLSFNERAAFIFKELQEMETEEIAEILGCSAVTVRGHLHSARKKLGKYFRDYREEP